MTRRSAVRTHRFTAVLERSDNKLWGAHLRVPETVAALASGPKDRRVRCRLNGEAEYQCAMVPFGGGRYVLTVNKSLRERLGLAIGSSVRVSIRRDESEYGLPVPEELAELFRQDTTGRKLFHALTKGKQRTLLYIIGKPKDPDVRARHAVTILRHLQSNSGAINYRQLAAALKGPRRGVPPDRRKGSTP